MEPTHLWERATHAIRTETEASSSARYKPSEHHETADNYSGVITHLCLRHRVIVCRDGLQWILQQRKPGGAERSWRAVGYFRTRDALMRASATLCGRLDPKATAILAALPRQIGGAS